MQAGGPLLRGPLSLRRNRRARRSLPPSPPRFFRRPPPPPRAALRRALDRVPGHVRVVRLVDREAQPRVHRRIGPAQTRGHRDLLDEPREDLALLGVRRRFLMLYVGPSGMSCHGRAARLEFGKAYNFIIRSPRQAFHDRTLAVTARASYRAVGVAMAIAGVVCFSLRPILIN